MLGCACQRVFVRSALGGQDTNLVVILMQLAWLEADLAAVDRSRTPWIIVQTHAPL